MQAPAAGSGSPTCNRDEGVLRAIDADLAELNTIMRSKDLTAI